MTMDEDSQCTGADGTRPASASAVSAGGGGEGTSNEEKKRMQQLLKIALPHLCLYVLLCLYLLAGAWAFARIEHSAERLQQGKKLTRVAEVYEQIASTLGEECGLWANDGLSAEQRLHFREQIYGSLGRISQFFEGPQFRLSAADAIDAEEQAQQHVPGDGKSRLLDSVLPPRWDRMSSILYALSILRAFKRLSVLCGLRQRQVISQVETKALKSLNRLQTKPMITSFSKSVKKRSGGKVQRRLTAEAQEDNEGKRRKESATDQNQNVKVEEAGKKGGKKAGSNKRRLPLSVNAAILLLFCMLGGLVYMAAGGSERNFIEGFFVTFNLVANLTMSEMPTDISHLMTLVYIFVFVTFGLAVLSMCADLAASELKWVFLKIHYFGRKINWSKRRAAKKQQQEMQFEVTELLKLIDQIRARYPDKEDISSLDILKYVQELNGGSFNGPYGGSGLPYRTFNMWLLQHHRRNTLAFMPQSFDALKFADEMDQEEEQLLNSTVGGLLLNWRRQRRAGEQNTFIPLLPFNV